MGFRHTEIGRDLNEKRWKEASQALRQLLLKHGGNQTKASDELGVDYRTLTRWLERLEKAGFDVRTQVLDELSRLKEEAEAAGTPPPPEPPKAGRKKR